MRAFVTIIIYFYRCQITPELRTDESHKFSLVTRRLGDPITEGIVVDAAVNEVSYNGFAQVQEGRQSLYWSLPPAFTGDKVRIYLFGLYLVWFCVNIEDVCVLIGQISGGIIRRHAQVFHSLLRSTGR